MTANRPALFNKDYQKEQSDKHRYKHIHTDEYCTFEAYIAELIVLRRSERLGLDRPGYKFWTNPRMWVYSHAKVRIPSKFAVLC